MGYVEAERSASANAKSQPLRIRRRHRGQNSDNQRVSASSCLEVLRASGRSFQSSVVGCGTNQWSRPRKRDLRTATWLGTLVLRGAARGVIALDTRVPRDSRSKSPVLLATSDWPHDS